MEQMHAHFTIGADVFDVQANAADFDKVIQSAVLWFAARTAPSMTVAEQTVAAGTLNALSTRLEAIDRSLVALSSAPPRPSTTPLEEPNP